MSPLAEEPIIICDNLMKIYKVANLEVVALQGLDLVVPRGELLGVVGASGSGKSTLMNILGGLDRPSAGRVWVNNQNLLKFSNSALLNYRRTQVGFVWQQSARNLIPFLNAQENVEMPLTLVGEAPRTKRKRARELLAAVGLAERMHHRVGQLSGGEQQRVAIAVALVHNPILLLADEPTGEVDSATALTIYQTFRDLNTTYAGNPIVSHDPTIAPRGPGRRHPRDAGCPARPCARADRGGPVRAAAHPRHGAAPAGVRGAGRAGFEGQAGPGEHRNGSTSRAARGWR